jgi:hypothetical protein
MPNEKAITSASGMTEQKIDSSQKRLGTSSGAKAFPAPKAMAE